MGKLIRLTSFHNRHEAEMLKERLIGEGIQAFVHADDGAGLLGGQTFALGVHVMVDEEQLDEALEIIELVDN